MLPVPPLEPDAIPVFDVPVLPALPLPPVVLAPLGMAPALLPVELAPVLEPVVEPVPPVAPLESVPDEPELFPVEHDAKNAIESSETWQRTFIGWVFPSA